MNDIVGRLQGAGLAGVTCIVLTCTELAAQSTVLPRSVTIARYGAIELGRPFVDEVEAATQVDDGLYLLPTGPGSTEGTLVELRSAGTVSGLVFFHRADKTYGEVVAGYAKELGSPAYGAEGDCASWRDQATVVEVVRVVTEDAELVLSSMYERDAPDTTFEGSCRLMTLGQVIVQGR
jgi:hypothetical protein